MGSNNSSMACKSDLYQDSEGAPLMACIDREGNHIFVNQQYRDFFKLNKIQDQTVNLKDLIENSDYQKLKIEIEKVLAGNTVKLCDWPLVFESIAHRFLINIMPNLNLSGSTVGFSLVLQENSESNLDSAGYFLKDIGTSLSKSSNMDKIYSAIAEALVPRYSSIALLSLFDDLGDGFLLKANPLSENSSPELEKIIDKYNRYVKSGAQSNPVVFSSISQLQGIVNFESRNDLESSRLFNLDEILLSLFSQYQINSGVVIPLKSAIGKPFGAIICLNSGKLANAITASKMTFVTELSRLCSIALENAKLLRKMENSMKVRDDFLAIASHELKTPITSLKLQLQILQRNIRQGKVEGLNIEKGVEVSVKQVNMLAKLVEDLVDASLFRIEKMELELSEFNFSEHINQIITLHGNDFVLAKNILTVDIERNIQVVWDRFRIEQMLDILLNNIIKHAPNCPIAISVSRKHSKIIITVQDKGPGIDILVQKKIFRRFERAHASRNVGGMGLGLFIAKKIIEAHRGTVKLESKLGLGSKFKIEIPIIASANYLKEQNRNADIE